jgi:hypothetical protein
VVGIKAQKYMKRSSLLLKCFHVTPSRSHKQNMKDRRWTDGRKEERKEGRKKGRKEGKEEERKERR